MSLLFAKCPSRVVVLREKNLIPVSSSTYRKLGRMKNLKSVTCEKGIRKVQNCSFPTCNYNIDSLKEFQLVHFADKVHQRETHQVRTALCVLRTPVSHVLCYVDIVFI